MYILQYFFLIIYIYNIYRAIINKCSQNSLGRVVCFWECGYFCDHPWTLRDTWDCWYWSAPRWYELRVIRHSLSAGLTLIAIVSGAVHVVFICVYPSQRCLASSQCLLAIVRIRGFDTQTKCNLFVHRFAQLRTNGIDPENIRPYWGIASVMLRQMEVEDVRVHWIPYIYIHIGTLPMIPSSSWWSPSSSSSSPSPPSFDCLYSRST
jgi:hypothetical protein